MSKHSGNEQENLMERVRALLALSKSSNPNEAAVAAAKVQELLTKYNLELDQCVELSEQSAVEEEDVTIESKVRESWVIDLATKLARHYMCAALIGHYGRYYFIGREANRKVCIETFLTLVNLFRMSSLDAMKQYAAEWKEGHEGRDAYANTWGSRHPMAYRSSWLEGAVMGVWKALRDQKAQMNADEKAIVLVRDQEVEDFKKQKYPKRSLVGDLGDRVGKNDAGMLAGHTFGQNALNQKLSSGGK